ncbi:hypothetical protein ACJW30_05G186800 [Castanea mollissima]
MEQLEPPMPVTIPTLQDSLNLYHLKLPKTTASIAIALIYIGIYSLYLCRGDVSNESCKSCVISATREIINWCPSSTEAIIWYDECMLRYADVNFFGKPDTQPWLIMSNVENTASPDQPNFYARILMEGLIGRANIEDRLFETHEQTLKIGDRSLTSYGLVQCTRDLDVGSCGKCLSDLMVEAQNCCESKIRWRISGPSCFLRNENYSFTARLPLLLPQPPLSQSVPAAPQPDNDRKTSQEIQSLNISSRSLSMHFMDSSVQGRDDDDSGEMHYFNLNTILTATNNFSDMNKLGEGGFGPVYKGKLINGKEIAVKRLSMKSKQGLEEFRNEVILIAKLQHKNLVMLLGCCLEEDEKLLVYEFMANTSLNIFLFDPNKCKVLDWAKHINIVNGVAKGLQYLHEDSRLKIIHRDMKASNVLLDDDMNPKISDFGTARYGNYGMKAKEWN